MDDAHSPDDRVPGREPDGHPGSPASPSSGPLRRSRFERLPSVLGRGAATAAIVVAATTGAGALAVLAGLLTLFGWGLAVGVALVVVTIGAALRPRPTNAWLLVPVLALALPAVAVAVSGVRVLPQRGAVIEAPTTAEDVPADGFRAGTGDLLVDLRDLRAGAGDRIVVRAGSDLGRTVVALPRNRCFALDVRWKTGDLRLPRVTEQPTVLGFRPGWSLKQIGQQGPRLRRRHAVVRGRIAVFGQASNDDRGRWTGATAQPNAPTLTLDLESDGGSFVVRDFPDDVVPLRNPEWPIDQVPPPYPRRIPLRALWAELDAQGRAATRATDARPDRIAPRPVPPTRTTVAPVPVPQPSARAIDRRDNVVRATRLRDRAWREQAIRRQAFGRAWAKRVAGACHPRGAFR